MTLLRALAGLGLCLMIQQALARFAPGIHDYVDLMLIPVVVYALRASQRSAMLVGCAGGLLQDAWFHPGVLGLNGFKKTLLGWLLGGLGTRFDLNHPLGRFVGGAALALGDAVLDYGLRRLLDQSVPLPSLLTVAIRVVVAGLLVVLSFSIVDRVSGGDRIRRGLLRRA